MAFERLTWAPAPNGGHLIRIGIGSRGIILSTWDEGNEHAYSATLNVDADDKSVLLEIRSGYQSQDDARTAAEDWYFANVVHLAVWLMEG